MQRNNDIINYIHGQKEFTEEEKREADVTEDGRVLVNDIVLIQKSKPTFVDKLLSIDKTGIYVGRTRELHADTKLAGFTIILNKPVSDITFINGTNNLVTETENETILTAIFDTPMEITTTTKLVHFNETEIPQFNYDDKRFMLSDQYGMVMNPQKEPTLSISVSTNIAVVTFRPYTVSTVDKTNHISNFQFDYDGINLTKLKKNPLSGYNVSIGKSRVIVYTMKGNIDLNTSENIVFEFEYTLASTPKIRSAMFVDAEINIASYVLLIPETLQLIYKQSVPYVNNNINALTEYKGLSNSTVGRTSFYYGDLTNDWVEPLNGVVDSDSSIETGNINVNDITLGLRMFVDKDVYNGTKAINEATATSEVDKIFVTKIQQLLVFADQPNTAIYTVEAISGIGFLAPPKTFALTNLRHILNIIDIALNKKPVVKYNGVVDVYKSNDDIVIKTSGVISGVTLYFEENNALLVDTVGIVSTESDETYTVALSGLPGGFVLGTHRIIAVDTGKGGIYCETTPTPTPTTTPTPTPTTTPTPTPRPSTINIQLQKFMASAQHSGNNAMLPHNLKIYLYNVDNNTLSPLLYNDTNLDNDLESLSLNIDNYDDSFNYKLLFFIHQDDFSFSDVGFDDIVYRIDDDPRVAFVSETSPFTFILQGRQTTPNLSILSSQETAFVRVVTGAHGGKVNISDTPKNTGLTVYDGHYLYFEGSQAFTNDVYLLSDVIPARTSPTQITSSGGTVSYADGYTIHTFTSSGDFLISESVNVEYLVVAGGGGGGNGNYAGGGGAGAFMEGIGFNTGGGSVIIGGGGSGSTDINQTGSSGSDSSFGTITANGGGGAGSQGSGFRDGLDGGSGGGGSRRDGEMGETNQASFGNNGGIGRQTGGGGGGAGDVGEDGGSSSDDDGKNGGIGKSSEISGTIQFYSAGGGGGCESNSGLSSSGVGGVGGTKTPLSEPTSGMVNTGSGGGGAGGGEPGASGGSGIVIIRYINNVSPN